MLGRPRPFLVGHAPFYKNYLLMDPIMDPITDPITDPIMDPITDPITDPISDPITDPITRCPINIISTMSLHVE
jgi:hypothetical protein